MNKENYFWKPLKIEGRAHKTFVWSDTHFGHKCENWDEPLWKKRGFSSVEEHDEGLISNWNKNVSNEDDIFHLGDIMFGANGESRLDKILFRLNFKRLFLMGGNHHSGYKQLLNSSYDEDDEDNGVWRKYYGYGKYLYFIPNYFEIFCGGQPFVLSHFPQISWNGQAKGSIMVFGHCHGSLGSSELGAKYLKEAKAEEVCFESHSHPVSFQYLIDKFKNRDNVTYDHHDSNTNNPF